MSSSTSALTKPAALNVANTTQATNQSNTQKSHPICQIIKAKIQRIWQLFVAAWQKVMQALGCLPCPCANRILSNKIQKQIQNIQIAKAAFDTIEITKLSPENADDQKAISLAKKKLWMDSFETAISETTQGILSAKINPTKLPRKVALQITEILTSYGIALYNNNEAAHPFKNAQHIIKLALLMQQYALGLSETCPDLTSPSIKSLCNEAGRFSMQADEAIAKIDPTIWAKKTSSLDFNQLKQLVLMMRYLNGCMRYLNEENLVISGRLLGAAEACLLAAISNPKFYLVDITDMLAELKYNEITGFLAEQARALEARGEKEQAQEYWQKLNALWDEVVKLSKEPAKMQARCDNKRTFVGNLTPQDILAFRIKSVEAHKALPPEKQDKGLLALALNNLSCAYQNVDGNKDELEKHAFNYAQEAWSLVIKMMENGIMDPQFDAIFENYHQLSLKKIAKAEQLNQQLKEISKNPNFQLDPQLAEELSKRMEGFIQEMHAFEQKRDH